MLLENQLRQTHNSHDLACTLPSKMYEIMWVYCTPQCCRLPQPALAETEASCSTCARATATATCENVNVRRGCSLNGQNLNDIMELCRDLQKYCKRKRILLFILGSCRGI